MLLARADSGDNALSAFKYYYYEPSMPAAIIFIVLFGLTTILHIAQMAATRTWFMIPFVIGGIRESFMRRKRRFDADLPVFHSRDDRLRWPSPVREPESGSL